VRGRIGHRVRRRDRLEVAAQDRAHRRGRRITTRRHTAHDDVAVGDDADDRLCTGFHDEDVADVTVGHERRGLDERGIGTDHLGKRRHEVANLSCVGASPAEGRNPRADRAAEPLVDAAQRGVAACSERVAGAEPEDRRHRSHVVNLRVVGGRGVEAALTPPGGHSRGRGGSSRSVRLRSVG
jgi:hypothetical protein